MNRVWNFDELFNKLTIKDQNRKGEYICRNGELIWRPYRLRDRRK